MSEVADRLRAPVEYVAQELVSGRLKGFQVGGDWRVPVPSLASFMGGGTAAGPNLEMQFTWSMRPTFGYRWPTATETFDEAWETDVLLESRQRRMVIAFTDRVAAGMLRRRSVVFLGRVPTLLPLVQFAGANDFATSQRMASVVKGRDGRHVRAIEHLPPEYQGMPTCLYTDIVNGPNAANSLAILAMASDHSLMAKHGVVRAAFKGWL